MLDALVCQLQRSDRPAGIEKDLVLGNAAGIDQSDALLNQVFDRYLLRLRGRDVDTGYDIISLQSCTKRRQLTNSQVLLNR